MLTDLYDNPISTRSREAQEHFNRALKLIRTYHGDPVAPLDAALDADPQFGLAWITRAILLAQTTDRAYLDEVHRSLRAAEACDLDNRERAHFAATKAWAEGRLHDSTTAFGRIALEAPRDVLALQMAHGGCFFTGRQFDLRDWPLQAMRAFGDRDEGRHAVLGMAAFGLEECGDYARALDLGMAATELEPTDAWAVHAVAHVHEMRGDIGTGKSWLTTTQGGWAEDCGFAYHNWWHLALLHLDAQDHAAALDLYDERVRPGAGSDIVLEMLDASALLWRLRLEGIDTGDRFGRLADTWSAKTAGHYAFNDVHAAMAMVGAGRVQDAEKLRADMRRSLDAGGDNRAMTLEVGLPLVEALIAFEAGRYAETVDRILPVRGLAQRFGGSHAQRDVLTLTALTAAIKGGFRSTAEALAAERLTHKPASPWARRLWREASPGGTVRAAE